MSNVSNTKVAKRYARALFAAAQKLGQTDSVLRDLDSLVSLWRQTPALHQMLESPRINADTKHELVDKVFSAGLEPIALSFLHLLIDKRREDILIPVRDEYQVHADDYQGLIRAHAVVATTLDNEQQTALIAGLEKRTGKRIELDVTVDESLLGGVIVRMNDTIIDGSVRGTLERIREKMLREA